MQLFKLSYGASLLFSYFMICPALWGQAPKHRHIEYGAANYSAVFAIGSDDRIHPKKNENLRNTVQGLIDQHGSQLHLYLNDMLADGLAESAESLKGYLQRKGYSIAKTPSDPGIFIELIPGNYFTMEIPFTDTAHLGNPDSSVLSDGKASDAFSRMAFHSKEGLEVSTYFYDEGNKGSIRKLEFLGTKLLDLGETATQYFRPDGQNTTAKPIRRFRVEPLPIHQMLDDEGVKGRMSNKDLGALRILSNIGCQGSLEDFGRQIER